MAEAVYGSALANGAPLLDDDDDPVTKELKGTGTTWAFTFKDVPKYHSGNALTPTKYTVTADAVDNYTTSFDKTKVTYAFTMPASDVTVDATIKRRTTIAVNLEGWIYGDEPNAPDVEGDTGNAPVAFAYKAVGAGSDWSDAVPVKAGDYTVKATVDETDDHLGGEATASFTISQRKVTLVGLSVSDKVYDGETDATVTGTPGLDDKLAGDDVSVVSNDNPATFEDANVREGKTVYLDGYSLTGEDAKNYRLMHRDLLADITPREVGLRWSDTTEFYLRWQ